MPFSPLQGLGQPTRSTRGGHGEGLRVSEYLFLAGITDTSSEGCIKAGGQSGEKDQPLAAGTVGSVSLTKCFVFSDPQGSLLRGGAHSLFRDEETEAEGDEVTYTTLSSVARMQTQIHLPGPGPGARSPCTGVTGDQEVGAQSNSPSAGPCRESLCLRGAEPRPPKTQDNTMHTQTHTCQAAPTGTVAPL